MIKIALAVLFGGVVAVGCGGDKGSDGAKSGSASASGAPKGPPASKACEEYFAKLKTCNELQLKAVPDAMKADMKQKQEAGEKATRESFKGMEGKALDDACTNAAKSLEAVSACK